MNVKDFMSNAPEFVPPHTTLQEAAELMRDNDFGFLPIGENDRLIGVLTDRDLVIRAVAKGWDMTKTSVRDAMTAKVLYVYEDETIEDAAESMCQQQVRRFIVLNRDKRMTGILALQDIAEKEEGERLTGHIIEEVTDIRRAA